MSLVIRKWQLNGGGQKTMTPTFSFLFFFLYNIMSLNSKDMYISFSSSILSQYIIENNHCQSKESIFRWGKHNQSNIHRKKENSFILFLKFEFQIFFPRSPTTFDSCYYTVLIKVKYTSKYWNELPLSVNQ